MDITTVSQIRKLSFNKIKDLSRNTQPIGDKGRILSLILKFKSFRENKPVNKFGINICMCTSHGDRAGIITCMVFQS